MKTRFLLSTLTEFPTLKDPRGAVLPEIMLAGRSNVGKSSLINHLFGKGLAKTSATPGKTQLLNFFCIEDRFILVDLPGYGFAKAPLEEMQKWSMAIEAYINGRESLKLILLLVDCRRELGEDDRKLIDWAKAKEIPLLLILTKTDKLNASEKEKLLKKYPGAIPYTVMNHSSRHIVKKRIDEILWD